MCVCVCRSEIGRGIISTQYDKCTIRYKTSQGPEAGEVSREGFIGEVIFELSLEGEVEGCSKKKEKHEPVLEA